MKLRRWIYTFALAVCTVAAMALNGCASSPQSQPTNGTATTGNQTTGGSNTTTNDTGKQTTGNQQGNGSSGTSTAPSGNKPPHKSAPKKLPLVELGNHSNDASYLNESLSVLGYLPVRFTPAHGVSTSTAETAFSLTTTPLPGNYTWTYSSAANALSKLWQPHTDNVITEGALMRFQLDHHLSIDGVAGPQVWTALQKALKAHEHTTAPYTYITVDESGTETLRVWQNNQVVLQTPANTGIASAPTSIGTWPIYLRYQSQEMRGTAPDGETYDDPGVPYVNYFHGGDAVHGFPRSQYGYPQSLGCVEIPISAAKTVYSLVNYGTLVSVRP
ncbi:L,D-transpeptidase family protein [Alicyclobacillus fodiniaquatilis]|uniref:L,D-transpeptidase family protein n=1 Tax=Alicyclobacillus fodiniaquatilis TaxID=1661150 RepID=A0ABW4JGN0_9BACL